MCPALSACLEAAERELTSPDDADTAVNAKDVLAGIGPAVETDGEFHPPGPFEP